MVAKINRELLKKIFEGALFAAEAPLTLKQLNHLVSENDIDNKEIKGILDEISSDYSNRSIELKEVASGYRFQVRGELARWISKLWEDKPSRYSRALLETLALVSYRQPITRAEIESVRGVAVSSNIIRTLLEHEWIKVAGHKDLPGRPALFVTTNKFLDYFNLASLKELPALQECQDLDAAAKRLEEQAAQQLTLDAAIL